MEFQIKEPLKDNVYNLMRELGYFFQGNGNDELSFVRPPRDYPRFHLYIKKGGETLSLNLHLDQKRPSYRGTTAHSGEYDGELVEKESERIKQILK